MFLCSYSGWQFTEFVQGRTSLSAWFLSHFYDKDTNSDWCAAQLLLDIMNIREGSSVLKFSDDSTFSCLRTVIYCAACSDEPYGLALVFLPFVFIFVCTLCTMFIINK